MLRTRCDDAYLFFYVSNNRLEIHGEMAERLTKLPGAI